MTRDRSEIRRPNAEPAGNPLTRTASALANITAADELRVTGAAIDAAMARSTWRSIQGMLTREFEGCYRRYYPKCRMDVRDEAAIAAVFDALAVLTNDPRRALRAGERTPAGGWRGGPSDA